MFKPVFSFILLVYVFLLLWYGFYFPGLRDSQLNQEFISATEQTAKEWSAQLDEYSLDDIVSGIREFSPAQKDSMIRDDIARMKKEIRHNIDRAIRVQALTGSDTIRKIIELAEIQFKTIGKNISPDEYYGYSNIQQLQEALPYDLFSPFLPVICILRNIDRRVIEQMTDEEQLEYMGKQVEFEMLADIRSNKKHSRFIKKNDTVRHALFIKALVSNGGFIYEKTNPDGDTGLFIRQLIPLESNVCLMAQIDDSGYYDAVKRFRRQWRCRLAFIILFFPVFYLIADYILYETAGKRTNYTDQDSRTVPAIWRILRGRQIAFWISIAYLSSASFLIIFMAADLHKMEKDEVDLLFIIFVAVFAAILLPVVVLVHRIRWFFRNGTEKECEYLMDEEIEKIGSVKLHKVMKLYFFSFQGGYHQVNGRLLKNYEEFENGKLRFTALFDPDNPVKAIIKDYYQNVTYQAVPVQGIQPVAIAWKFKAFFSDPFSPETTDLGIIEDDRILETFEKIPWKDLMEKMKAANFNGIYDFPSLIFERTDSRKQIVLTIFEGDEWDIEYYRMKAVMWAFGPSRRKKVYDRSELKDQSIDVVCECLKALMENDQEFFDRKMPPIRY